MGMVSPINPTPQPMNPEQELEALKGQSQMLAQQLAEIQRRIEEMEKKKK
jgi:prefoldin subunit 5